MRRLPKYPPMIDKIAFIREQLAFRMPRRIRTIVRGTDGYSTFYCPSCNTPIPRDFQEFCNSCGQHLDWDGINFNE